MNNLLNVFRGRGYRKITFGTLFSGLNLVLSLLLASVITNNFSLEVYGQLSILAATLSSASLIMNFPTTPISIKYLSGFIKEKKYSNFRAVLILEILFQLSVCLILFISIFLFSPIISKYTLKDSSLGNLFLYYSVITIIYTFRSFINSYLNVFKKFKSIFLLNFFETLIKLAGVFIYVNFNSNRDVLSIIKIYIISSGLIFIFYFFYFLSHFLNEISFGKIEFKGFNVKNYFKFSSQLFLSSTLKGFHSKLPELFLSFFTNASTVGLYSIYKKAPSLLSYYTSSISIVNYPKIIDLKLQNKLAEIKKVFNQYNLEIVTLNLVLATISILFSDYIANFFGIDNLDSIVFCVVFLSNTIANLNWWNKGYSEAFEPRLSIKLHFLIFISLIVTLPVCTNYYSLVGTYTSIALANLIGVILMRFHAHKKLIK